MKKPLKTKELEYLETYVAGDLTQETLAAIREKRIMLEDEPLYIRAEVVGGGEQELLTASIDEQVGITNIDKKKLPKYTNFVINAIQFGYASAPVADNAEAVEVQYDSIIDNVPVALQHANLVIKQNDNPIVTIQVKELLQQEKVRGAEGDSGYELKYLRLLKEEVPFQISIKFPDGQALPAGVVDHFVEVRLKGTRTRLRGNR